MHVLHELVCGIRGAELGTVDIYARGTSTRVTYYTSFEGDGSTTPTSGTTLDANGGGEFYVNEICDVVVRDSGGTEVRRFTSAPAASAVEVISQSFTGTDYDTGASAHTKPVALSTVLDRAYTSLGARDWNVLYGGTSITLQSLAAKVGTLFFNVKDPDYGATGDGTTDDTAAIQEALDAAGTAGGGIVFFPIGTYSVSSTGLSVPNKVSLLGAGPAASVIALASDVGSGPLTFAASGTYVQTVEGLRISPAVATSKSQIVASSGSLVVIRNCYIGNATHSGYAVLANSANSHISIYSTTIYSGFGVQSQGGLVMVSCKMILPATHNATLITQTTGTQLILFAVEFDASGMSAGTGYLFTYSTNSGTGKGVVIVGCSCGAPAGGTLTTQAGLGAATAGDFGAFEAGNTWASALGRGSYGTAAGTGSYTDGVNLERDRRRYYTADDTAAVAINAMANGYAEVLRATTDVQTVTISGPGPLMSMFTLAYRTNAVASGTITIAGNVKGLTTFTVNNTKVSYYFFQSVHVGANKFWVLFGSLLNQDPT